MSIEMSDASSPGTLSQITVTSDSVKPRSGLKSLVGYGDASDGAYHADIGIINHHRPGGGTEEGTVTIKGDMAVNTAADPSKLTSDFTPQTMTLYDAKGVAHDVNIVNPQPISLNTPSTGIPGTAYKTDISASDSKLYNMVEQTLEANPGMTMGNLTGRGGKTVGDLVMRESTEKPNTWVPFSDLVERGSHKIDGVVLDQHVVPDNQQNFSPAKSPNVAGQGQQRGNAAQTPSK